MWQWTTTQWVCSVIIEAFQIMSWHFDSCLLWYDQCFKTAKCTTYDGIDALNYCMLRKSLLISKHVIELKWEYLIHCIRHKWKFSRNEIIQEIRNQIPAKATYDLIPSIELLDGIDQVIWLPCMVIQYFPMGKS